MYNERLLQRNRYIYRFSRRVLWDILRKHWYYRRTVRLRTFKHVSYYCYDMHVVFHEHCDKRIK